MSLNRRVINELRRDWTDLWQVTNSIFYVKREQKIVNFQIYGYYLCGEFKQPVVDILYVCFSNFKISFHPNIKKF